MARYSGDVGKISVKVEQPFHFKNLYQYMHLWLVENGFESADGDGDKWETFYLEKIGQVKEYWVEWDMVKNIHKNKYYNYKLNVKMHLLGMKKIEVMQEGHKVKLDHGEIEIIIDGKIQTDLEGKWKKHWFLKNFKKVYDERIFKEEFMGMHEVNLYRLMYEFQGMIKKYMAIRCYAPVEGFLHAPENQI
jgi:hypothetical protein